jgi:plastocyanin
MIIRRPRLLLTAVSVAALTGMAAYLPSAAQTLDSTRILIKDFMFMPTPLTVKAGSSVVWSNMDDEPHNVVSDTGMFRSGGMDTSETFTYKFDKPGTYHFTCSIHPRMVGTIVVQ